MKFQIIQVNFGINFWKIQYSAQEMGLFGSLDVTHKEGNSLPDFGE
jgi:hypothetical protein